MSPDRKHGREAAHRRAAAAASREAARRRQRRRLGGVVAVIGVLAIVLGVVAIVPGDDDEEVDALDTDTTIVEDTTTTTGPSERGPFEYGTGECPPAEKPAEPPETFDDAPRRCTDDGVDYRATVETTEGSFVVDLLESAAPGTVNNFVVLARWGWFDGVAVHRVVPGFVIQTGDPVGNPPGTGSPGYTIDDEHPSSLDEYAPGTVAMANTGAPRSGGSQWFVCVDCSPLPSPTYPIFGRVTEGMDVVEAINALGGGDGPPSKPVTVTSVTIVEA